MKLKFRCGCGMYNYCASDWLCHWKYSEKGKLHAIKLLLKTRIEIAK